MIENLRPERSETTKTSEEISSLSKHALFIKGWFKITQLSAWHVGLAFANDLSELYSGVFFDLEHGLSTSFCNILETN